MSHCLAIDATVTLHS